MRIQSRSGPRPSRPESRQVVSIALSLARPAPMRRCVNHAGTWLTIILVITQSMCSFGPASAECIDYGDYLHWVGGVAAVSRDAIGDVLGSDVAVSGNYAYITHVDWPSGLQVIDIGDPQKPQIVGSVRTAGNAGGVAISGAYAYVAEWQPWSGLEVIDITDPTAPRIVGSVVTPGGARHVVISGHYAYVAGYGTLMVIDVANPQDPRTVGSLYTPGYPTGNAARGFAVSGTHAYFSETTRSIDGMWGSALQVIDIANPASPRLVGSLRTSAGNVAISGGFAYVEGACLQVIDISNPVNPRIMGSAECGGSGVAISGGFAYVAGAGLQVIDISNPASPRIMGSVECGDASGVAVLAGFAYVAGAGLQVIDIANPTSPIVGNLRGPFYDVAVAGTYACVVPSRDDTRQRLSMIDISNPARLTIAGSVEMFWGLTECVAVSGTYAYVSGAVDIGDYNYNSCLLVIDISNPTAPRIVGSVTAGASDISISGGFAYTAGGPGLQVIDISNPARPQITGGVATPEEASGVALSGHYAYLAAHDSGLLVIDITNPRSPQLVGSLDTPGWASDVVVSGGFAYLTDGPGGLHVIDITTPASPQIVGSVDTPRAVNLAVSGTAAYVTTDNFGLQVIDITNPRRPQLVGSGYAHAAHAVAVSDDYVCVAAEAGLQILPLQCDSAPHRPQIVNVTLPPDVEWLRNQQMVAFQLHVEVHDQCDPNPSSRIVSVTTDPPSHPNGNHVARPDWGITDALSLRLPMDFSQGRTGRLYRVTVVSSDETGNSTAAVAAIRVAFDHGRPVVRLETLELDQELPADLIAHSGESGRSGSGETEEVSKSSPSTEGQYGAHAIGLVGTFPNPMGWQGQVQFFLPAAAHVRLAIYDVRGRLVSTLAQGSYSPGLHSASWESRSDDGSILSQGIYFARLDVDGQRFTRRFVVVR